MRRAQSDEEPPDEWEWTAADAERLVLPPPGYGMGIKGNSRNYYDAANSLLPYVRALRCADGNLVNPGMGIQGKSQNCYDVGNSPLRYTARCAVFAAPCVTSSSCNPASTMGCSAFYKEQESFAPL